MGGPTIEEQAAEAVRRIRAYEREYNRKASYDDIKLAVRIVGVELDGLYERKVLRRTIDILAGR